MRRAVTSTVTVALVIAVLVGGIAVYALPMLAANKSGSIAATESSTVTSTETVLQPTTVTVTNTTASGGSSLVVVSGSLSIPSGAGSGILAMTVTDQASYPITQIAIGVSGADGPMTVTWSAQNGAADGFGAPGAAVPIPVLAPPDEVTTGSSGSIVGKVGGVVTPGDTYTFSVYSYLGSSLTPIIETFSVTAAVFHV
jgi:hypothetical protein